MGIFSQNSGFVKFVNRALDVIFLNVLWIVCSLPIITLGASTCAAYSVTLKMVDDEEGYVGKMFFKAFKENFKYGTFMWLIDAPLIYILTILWQIVIKDDEASIIAILGCILLSAVVFAGSVYAYPLIARYDNKFFNMIKNSFGISIQYFGKTFLILVLLALEIFIIMWNKYTFFVGILLGPEFMIYTISGISKRIFQKLDKNYENAMAEEKAKEELKRDTELMQDQQNLTDDTQD